MSSNFSGREVIAVVGGAAAWPLAADAQSNQVPHIAVLMQNSAPQNATRGGDYGC
jgi:hypothetical protein